MCPQDSSPCTFIDPSMMFSRYLLSLYYVPVRKQNPALGAYIAAGNVKDKQSLVLVKVERTDSAAAAAPKSLQSCLTLCDPIDGSPPGSPIPGILQARTLEWVAISFSNTDSEQWHSRQWGEEFRMDRAQLHFVQRWLGVLKQGSPASQI